MTEYNTYNSQNGVVMPGTGRWFCFGDVYYYVDENGQVWAPPGEEPQGAAGEINGA